MGNGNKCKDCAGVANGGKTLDLCNKCLSPKDENFDSACVKIGKINPGVGSVAGGMVVTMKASGLKSYKTVTCNFVGSTTYAF